MTYDEQHGWVERGTRGVHSGAVVRDVGAEIALLDKLSRESYHDGYWWPQMPRAQRMQQLEQSLLYHVGACSDLIPMRRQAWPLHISRDASAGYITHKLALLAPYIAILRAGDEKRQRDIAEGRHGL